MDYLASRPGEGFEPGDYRGRDLDFLDEDEWHPEDCLCTEQCFPEGDLRFVEVSREELWRAYGVSEWPEQDLGAAGHYAGLVLDSLD